MSAEDDVTPVAAMFLGHPATRPVGEPILPAYPPPPHVPAALPWTDPAYEPWAPAARFAPPGPAAVSMAVPGATMRLGLLDLWQTHLTAPAAPVSALPEALWDEPEVLDDIAHAAAVEALHEDVAEPPAPEPPPPAPHPDPSAAAYWAAITGTHENVLPEDRDPPPAPERAEAVHDPAVTAPAADAGAEAAQTAYWATSPAPADDPATTLAWNPPAAAAADRTTPRRSTPAMDGLWAAEPVGSEDDIAAVTGGSTRRLVFIAIGASVVAVLCIAAILVLPRMLAGDRIPAATFNAPMMVLRAAITGRIASVGVTNGQSVEPSTVLLTIHTDPQPNPAATLLRDRLDAARSRMAALDDSLAQPIPNNDAGKLRLADLRRQRAAAATDVAQLQDGIANIPAQQATDQPVRAGVHGVIRSLEAQTGSAAVAGAPLVRILDCDHAFLTVAPNAKLQVGQAVQVRLANLPAVAATVRQSSGIAEPPDALVIAPAAGAFVNILSGSCPIGATATVTPIPTGR